MCWLRWDFTLPMGAEGGTSCLTLPKEPWNCSLVGISVPLPFPRLIPGGNVPFACLDKKTFPLTGREYLKQVYPYFPKTIELGCLGGCRCIRYFALFSELAGLLGMEHPDQSCWRFSQLGPRPEELSDLYQVYGPACETSDMHCACLALNHAAFQVTCFVFHGVFIAVCQCRS